MNYWPTYMTFIIVEPESDFSILDFKHKVCSVLSNKDFNFENIGVRCESLEELIIEYDDISMYLQLEDKEDDWVKYQSEYSDTVKNLLLININSSVYSLRSTDDSSKKYEQFNNCIIDKLATYSHIHLFDINQNYKRLNNSNNNVT
jgi:hypothetical protein